MFSPAFVRELLHQRQQLGKAYSLVPGLVSSGDSSLVQAVFSSPHIDGVAPEVREWMHDREADCLRLHCMVEDTAVSLRLFSWDDESLFAEAVVAVLAWLQLCHTRPLAKLTVDIMFTPVKRHLRPGAGGGLTRDNVNGGFAIRTGDEAYICVYRLQEWFKVFIHETVHAFRLEPPFTRVHDGDCARRLGYDKPFSLRETYCELVARVNQCVFSSYRRTSNPDDYLRATEHGLALESAYSWKQASQLLDSQGVLCSRDLGNWVEETEGIAYFLYTTAILSIIRRTTLWLAENSRNLSGFDGNSHARAQFCALIKDGLNNDRKTVRMAATGYLDINKLL